VKILFFVDEYGAFCDIIFAASPLLITKESSLIKFKLPLQFPEKFGGQLTA
jgi:hypothetical protein